MPYIIEEPEEVSSGKYTIVEPDDDGILSSGFNQMGKDLSAVANYGLDKFDKAQAATETFFKEGDVKSKTLGLGRGAVDLGIQGVLGPGAAIKNVVQEAGRGIASTVTGDETEGNFLTRAWEGTKKDLQDITAASYSGEGGEKFSPEWYRNNPASAKGLTLVEGLGAPFTDLEEGLNEVSPYLGSSAMLLLTASPLAAGLRGAKKATRTIEEVKPGKVREPFVIEEPPVTTPEPVVKGSALTDPTTLERIAEIKRKEAYEASQKAATQPEPPLWTQTPEGELPALLRREKPKEEAALPKQEPDLPSLLKKDPIQETLETAEVGNLLQAEKGKHSPLLEQAHTALEAEGIPTTLGPLLSVVAKEASSGLTRTMASMLERVTGHIPYSLVDQSANNWIGSFDPYTNSVKLDPNRGLTVSNVLHEAIHGMGLAFQKAYPEHSLNKAINLLWEEAKKAPTLKNHSYFRESVYEFLSELGSNHGFQSRLIDLQLPKDVQIQLGHLMRQSEGMATKPRTAWEGIRDWFTEVFTDQVEQAGLGKISPDNIPDVGNFLEAGLRVLTDIGDIYVPNSQRQAFLMKNLVLDTQKKQGILKGNPNMREFAHVLDDYEKMTSEVSTKDFIGNWKSKLLNLTDAGVFPDIGHQFGLSSASYRAKTQYLKDMGNMAKATANHVTEQVVRYLSRESAALHLSRGVLDDFHNLYSKGGFLQVKQFKGDVKIRLAMENDAKSWGGGTNKWAPTIQDMVAQGMSETSAKAWAGIDYALDIAWKSLETTAKMNGLKIPPRIPGYLPHIFKGAYAVKIKLREVGGKGGEIHWKQYNYDSRKAAQPMYDGAYNDLNGKIFTHGGKDYRAIVEKSEPNLLHNNAAEQMNAMWQASTDMPIAPLSKVLDIIYEKSTQGLISNVLDRNNLTQKGHLFERVNEQGNAALSSKQLKDAVSALDQYIRGVHGWEARAAFVHEVLMPLKFADFFEGRPNLTKYVQDTTNAFFGIPESRVKFIEDFISTKLQGKGFNPELVRDMSREVATGLYVYYLTFNPAYYIANILQYTLGPSILMMEKAKFQMTTGKSPSVSKALLDYSMGVFDKAKKAELRDYAIEHGFSAPIYVETILPGQSVVAHQAGWLSRKIDTFTRNQGYNMGYYLARQVMPENLAKEYAGHVSREINVPYGPEAGAPLAFGKMGIAKPLTTFMTFAQHNLGTLNQMAALTSANWKGNRKASVSAIQSAAAYVGTGLSLYGLQGVPFSSTYDSLAMFVSNAFGWNWDSTKELGRRMEQGISENKLGAFLPTGMLTFGLASTVVSRAATTVPQIAANLADPSKKGMENFQLGEAFDVSGAGTGVGFNISTVATKFAGDVLTLAMITGDVMKGALGGNPPTHKEVGKAIKALPNGPVRATAEFYYKHGPLKNILKFTRGEEQDFSVTPNNIDLPGNPRTSPEFIAQMFGVPLREAHEKISDNTFIRNQMTAQKKLERYTQLFLEGNAGVKPGRFEELSELALEAGKNPIEYITTMKNYEETTSMDKHTREATEPGFRGTVNNKLRNELRERVPERWRYDQ